jgi:hypothetical protein
MKSKIILTVTAIALLMVPSYLCASTVLDVAGTIQGFKLEVYPFFANETPFTYEATLVDLSDIIPGLPPGTKTGFEMLSLSVTNQDGDPLGSANFSGSFPFPVNEGEKYYAWVNGNTGDTYFMGAYEVTVAPVPIPTTLLLLGSGLIGLIAIRRKRG